MTSPFDSASRPAGLSPQQQAAFEQLRQRFIAGLPARWQQISGAADRTARIQALHQLAGAAGSYGLAELSAAARRAEQLAIASDAGAGSPDAAQQHAFSELADMLQRSINAA